MKKWFAYGGIAASIILVALGTGAIVIGATGIGEVHTKLSQERIVGSADMTPVAIKEEAKDAKLPSDISLPTCSVAGKTVDTGRRPSASRATCGSTRSRRRAGSRTRRWAAS